MSTSSKPIEAIHRAAQTASADLRSALVDMGGTKQSVAIGLAASQTVSKETSGIQSETLDVVQAIRDIAESTREQSATTTEVARAAEEVNLLKMKTDQVVHRAWRTFDELGALSAALYEMVGRFRL